MDAIVVQQEHQPVPESILDSVKEPEAVQQDLRVGAANRL
jgi:hypothetical protein